MVGYIGFGVGFAGSWDVVGNCVVDGLAAYVACPSPPAYVLPHAGLHGAIASTPHVVTSDSERCSFALFA